MQGQFTYACVINMNGLPRFSVADSGGGYAGARLKNADGSPDDLIRSEDKHFRPADPQIGPDGALWFGDWANALIGHMQYSQRDPNRDHTRGRIYRLLCPDRPLTPAVTQFGKSAAEILEQLREYEWRTRYRARRELHGRPTAEVLPAVAAWVAALKPQD
ncbi:MAG: heme-binding protein, partial [Planctomycetaceae bacterium]